MKKITLLTMLGCLLFNIINVGAQTNLDGGRKIPLMTIIIADNPIIEYDSEPNEGEELPCNIRIDASVYVTHLEQFNVNSNTATNEGNIFYLPNEFPDLEIHYTVGTISGVHPIRYFEHFVHLDLADASINTYKYEFSIVMNISDECAASGSSNQVNLEYEFTLVDPNIENNVGREYYYPVCDYRELGDIFDSSFIDLFPFETDAECNYNNSSTVSGLEEISCIAACRSFSESGNDGFTDRDNESFENDLRSEKISKDYEVSVYPNPFYSKVNIHVYTNQNSAVKSIEIFSLSGKLLYHKQNYNLIEKSIFSPNLDHLPQGLYFLKINYEYSHKIIKLAKR